MVSSQTYSFLINVLKVKMFIVLIFVPKITFYVIREQSFQCSKRFWFDDYYLDCNEKSASEFEQVVETRENARIQNDWIINVSQRGNDDNAINNGNYYYNTRTSKKLN